MVASTPLSSLAFSRRTLLAASAAGLGVLLVGCTSDGKAPVTAQQADQLAGQVAAQEALVDAFAAAAAADSALGGAVADQATQVQQQLDRLRAAAPGPSASAASSAAAVPAGQDPRAWLRTQVAATADSHAKACLDQIGARAALLGSIAAGLRGMDGTFA
ncbi:hypothetical protein [Petropleomorpha daqingensis]|uniref:Tat (Twin-arginine translocation) pathway signal sequence n=1 Tax=Petropleomorpha daqingensis TaxID=2026353 RepID=A0A853CAQ1_9ACTN|nr:hypothetical protein [Petropleomorpha daqingensis]NYJ04239.1 hypothetical protein [Petropleomorpha daqingensis]